MDIGAKFDDSLFEVADESKLQKVIEDEKNCSIREPLWFVDANPEGLGKDQEQMQLYKSQGDWLYYNKDHEGAARKYQQALGILPKGNATVKRDLLECISCCHIALGHENEALKYAHLLRDEGTNFEQQTVILNLLKSIHHQFGNTSGELIVLEKLLSLHPYNHHLWIELAEVFRIKRSQESESDNLKLAAGNKNEACVCHNQFSSETAEMSISERGASDITSNVLTETVGSGLSLQVEGRCIHCPLCLGIIRTKNGSATMKVSKDIIPEVAKIHNTNYCTSCFSSGVQGICECKCFCNLTKCLLPSVKTDLVIAVCLIRARLLLQSVQTAVASFGKEKHKELLVEICQKLKSLDVSQEQMDYAVKFLSQDVYKKEKEECKPLEDSKQSILILDTDPIQCARDFNHTWFLWLKQK